MSTPAFTAPVADMHRPIHQAKGSSAESEAATFWENVVLNSAASIAGVGSAISAAFKPAPEIGATAVATGLQTDSVIEKILAHRRDHSCDTRFEMNVLWEGGRESWTPEIELQKDHALTLFAYWSSMAGGRESAMVDRELWHVFKIVSCRTNASGNTDFRVAWVGSPERSWEPEATIRDADGELVEQYWEAKGGRGEAGKKSAGSKSFVDDVTRVMAGRGKMGRGAPRRRSECHNSELSKQ
ncbi:chromo domain-containing protein [Colletotrichum orchidophilum]|uniref:Chromo domain-containing protein n=1 Tax=Colletotrichum orchidophilum TaxID=1209926 RepID=A0A1G4AMB2_9PEZI|nr:chromo domain-containing protein [Colletotrichum orchidophilum]OHE90309.1 chromo domain-containing protein [Colletotrichum orchidophilum]